MQTWMHHINMLEFALLQQKYTLQVLQLQPGCFLVADAYLDTRLSIVRSSNSLTAFVLLPSVLHSYFLKLKSVITGHVTRGRCNRRKLILRYSYVIDVMCFWRDILIVMSFKFVCKTAHRMILSCALEAQSEGTGSSALWRSRSVPNYHRMNSSGQVAMTICVRSDVTSASLLRIGGNSAVQAADPQTGGASVYAWYASFESILKGRCLLNRSWDVLEDCGRTPVIVVDQHCKYLYSKFNMDKSAMKSAGSTLTIWLCKTILALPVPTQLVSAPLRHVPAIGKVIAVAL